MGNFIKTQNMFTSGEVAPEFYARDDINGLSRMENMDVLSGGGLRRRPGLTHVADLLSCARLIPFSVSENENYVLALGAGRIWIYSGSTRVASLESPWDMDKIPSVQYAQRFGTMIFVHPDVAPKILRRTDTGFELSDFAFARNDADMSMYIPFIRFDDSKDIEITVTTSERGNNYAKFTTNADFWSAEYVGNRMHMMGKQWIVAEYISPTEVIAYVNGTYTLPDEPVKDWSESAFSNARGWPISIVFHQDRLIFGGSRSYPAGIWMSRVGLHNNFDIGTGLDDEAIFITLLSQQRQHICTIVSSDNLQILTSVGEWAISNNPLTPSSVNIKQHTSVGSFAGRYLPTQSIEGTTVFISNNLCDIRELSLDELSENYNATDLCTFSKHLMTSPIDMAYNDNTHQLFVVMENGDMAVLNQNTSMGINAWGTYKTYGDFKSVAVMGGITYVVVSRSGKYSLECFDSAAMQDINTYDFAFYAAALPLRTSSHNASRVRIRQIRARVIDTKSICINGTRVTLPNEIYTDDSPGFSGDVSVNVLGTLRNGGTPIWTIHGNEPQPATILSVCVSGWYSV